MSFKKQRMVKIRFRGSDLADLDFWSKSDPFLVLSRPRRNSYGLQQVSYHKHTEGLPGGNSYFSGGGKGLLILD